MGLIDETNAQYYTGEERFNYTSISNSSTITSLTVNLDTKLISEGQLPNYDIYVNNTQTSIGNGGSFVLYTGGSSVDDFNEITIDTPINIGVGFTLTTGGTGYGPTLTNLSVTGGSGIGMLVDITEAGGVVQSITIVNAGTGYACL